MVQKKSFKLFKLLTFPTILQATGKKWTKKAGHWWLMSIILATQEAEIRRMVVQSQPRQIVLETLSQKKTYHKKGLVEWPKV
jgi:hypothetical protein